MSRNRVIGRKGAPGGLPWHMPADLKRFKQRTMGHATIMGRRTWDTMKAPLPGRTNIVITRDRGFGANGAIIVQSLEDALRAAREALPDQDEIFITGGAEIFRLALPIADVIDLTLIETNIDGGDALFPEFECDSSWRLMADEAHGPDAKNPHAYRFQRYERDR